MRLVFDLEANGLYDDKVNKDGTVSKAADIIWCIVTKDIDSSHISRYTSADNNISLGIKHLESANELVCHNQIDYDLRLIKRLYPSFKPKGLILDTMILSQMLNSDRKGGHGLASYGEELGIAKPVHEDWSKFSPEMLHRCAQDVEINHLVYEKLMEEAYEDIRGLEYHKVFTNQL